MCQEFSRRAVDPSVAKCEDESLSDFPRIALAASLGAAAAVAG